MKIYLDNEIIETLYKFLAKGRGDMDKMQVNIKDGVLKLVATNGQILGVFERKVRINEETENCSFLMPLQEFGKVSIFKRKVLTLTSDDGRTGTLSFGQCKFDFEMQKGHYPNWTGILIKEGKPLQEYRVFEPEYLDLVSQFVPTAYCSQIPMIDQNKYGPAMWTEETNMYKKIVLLSPLGKI